MVTPFGPNLSFSSYEEAKKSELASAKPTDMSDADSATAADVDGVSGGSEDLDFESLL